MNCNCNACILEAMLAEKPTPINPGSDKKIGSIVPEELIAWLVRAIDFNRESSDPDGIAAGLEYVLKVLNARQRYLSTQGPDPLPLLQGRYEGIEGYTDALGTLAVTLYDAAVSDKKAIRITVEEVQ